MPSRTSSVKQSAFSVSPGVSSVRQIISSTIKLFAVRNFHSLSVLTKPSSVLDQKTSPVGRAFRSLISTNYNVSFL